MQTPLLENTITETVFPKTPVLTLKHVFGLTKWRHFYVYIMYRDTLKLCLNYQVKFSIAMYSESMLLLIFFVVTFK